jgi:hypothetical protein
MKIKMCFVIETTYKMTPYLYDVQCDMEHVLHRVRFYNPHAEVLVAAVTYRDYKDCDQTGVRDWISADNFWEFWEDLEQESRTAWFNENDAADVAGGVNCALNLDWSNANVRLVFHYGISPAHGRQFCGLGVHDNYPDGDPNGKDLLRDMYAFSWMPCDYTFYRITPMVDTMLSLMDEAYTGGGKFKVENLDVSDSYISEPDSEEE